MKRTFSLFLAAVIIIAVIIGLVKRSTYTDITREPEYLNHFSVAELPENLAVENAALLPTELKNAPIVLQVAPVGGIEAVFKTLRQPVEIVHILKGSDLIDETIGEQIYITRASWCLFFDDMTANLGFVNTMRHGQYYLIFLEGKVELPEAQKSPTNIYYLCNTIVTPVFSYTEGEDVVIPIDTVPTYVPYTEVENNTFFAASQKSREALELLRNELTAVYQENRSAGLP